MKSALKPETIKQLRALSKKSLFFFAKGILGFDWLNSRIHLPLCRLLENYKENRRMCICLPRGWLKTTICSQAYPLWRAIRDPNVRILITQNTHTNAVSKIKVIKAIVEGNPLFRILFPELLPTSQCTWKAESLELHRTSTGEAEGTFDAAGTGTQLTSRHYNVIIEDDTVAPDFNDLGEQNLAPTKEQVTQAIGYHRLMPPLLVDQGKDQIIVVGTRWFEKDLISWVGQNEKYYKSYFRACRENDKGEADEHGKITYPERFDEGVLNELRVALGPYIFSCLYFNKPVRSDDMIFHLDWFQYYETPPKNLVCYTTVDPGGDPNTTDGEPDPNVVMTCGKDVYTGRVYVLEYTKERFSPGQLLTVLFEHVKCWNPVKVGIESVQYQSTLLYWATERMRKTNTYFFVEKIRNSKMSKYARVLGLQPVFASGSLFVKSHMIDLVKELLAFPLGANDDLVDALAMQLEMWQATKLEHKKAMDEANDDPLSAMVAIRDFRAKAEEKTRHRDNLVLDMMVPAGDAGPLSFSRP